MQAFLPSATATLTATDSRWEDRLPPDIRRAAPEIYRSLRSQGSATVREWLAANFSGSKQSSTWLDLWNLATEVDFAMSQCGGAEQQLRRLATDDNMEIKMRRLSSYIYETRTGDRVGAASMLALQPPGAGLDLAPTWLVADATAHSKSEFMRSERVHKTRDSGAGGGRGSPGGKAEGKGSGKPHAGGGGYSRGKGGGRGGRSGRLPQG